MKKALGLLIALGAMSLMSVSAYAATYSVSGTASDGIVTVTLKAAPDTNTASVNGYALNVSYDSSVLTPVGLTDSNGDAVTDATGAQLYAENALDESSDVFVASTATVDDKSVVAVAWANDEAVTLDENGTALATITFAVDKDATASTDLNVVVKADASSSTKLVAHSSEEVATGTVTLGGLLYGDADGNGIIGSNDAFTVLTWASGTGFADAQKTQVDVDGNNIIGANDAFLILQKAANSSLVFPVEASK
jgi:glutamine cyclotransferase